jgi:WD40 repeat protein
MGNTVDIPQLRRLDCWKAIVQRLADVLPRFLPITTVFLYSCNVSEFDIIDQVESLLSACERATTDVPLECLKFLWGFAAQEGCDPQLLTECFDHHPHRYGSSGPSVLDMALVRLPDHAHYLICDALAFNVDVLQCQSRLPRLLNLRKSDPIVFDWAVGSGLSRSLRQHNMTRHALSSFFASGYDGPCSVIFTGELHQDIFVEILRDSNLRYALAVDIHAKKPTGFSLLHYAVDSMSFEAVHVLLELGANPFAVDKDQRSPLDVALTKVPYDPEDLAKIDAIRKARISQGVYKEQAWAEFRTFSAPVFRDCLFLLGHSAPVTTLDFKRGKLVSGSIDGFIFLWHCNSYSHDFSVESYRHVLPQEKGVKQVILSKDATFLISLLVEDNKISVWAVPDKSLVVPIMERKLIITHGCIINTISLSFDESTVISGDISGQIRLWDLSSGTCIRTIEDAASGPIVSLFSSVNEENTKILASAAEAGTVKLWNYTDGSLIESHSIHEETQSLDDKTLTQIDQITSIALPPDDSILAIGTRGSTWRIKTRGPEPTSFEITLSLGTINSVNYSPNRFWMLFGTSQGIRLIDLEAKSFILFEHDWDLNPRTVNCGCLCTVWSEDGEFVFTGWEDGIIRASRV